MCWRNKFRNAGRSAWHQRASWCMRRSIRSSSSASRPMQERESGQRLDPRPGWARWLRTPSACHGYFHERRARQGQGGDRWQATGQQGLFSTTHGAHNGRSTPRSMNDNVRPVARFLVQGFRRRDEGSNRLPGPAAYPTPDTRRLRRSVLPSKAAWCDQPSRLALPSAFGGIKDSATARTDEALSLPQSSSSAARM